MKVPRGREGLPDDSRSHNGAVSSDELPVGHVRKHQLGDSGRHSGVRQPDEDDRDDRHAKRDEKMCGHANPSDVITKSTALIPMKGTINPPNP